MTENCIGDIMEKTFTTFNISEATVKSLSDMGYTAATKVQERAIPMMLEGKDVIVNAKTGSGKTAAFGIPIIERIEKTGKAPKALILTPTRELAIQVKNELTQIAKGKKLRVEAVYGQHNIDQEFEQLKKGIDIVVGTPGRVNDHIERETLNISEIAFITLDEADRMLDMGFIDQVNGIIKQLPANKNCYLFSATMPFEIKSIAWEFMQDPETIEISSDSKTVDKIDQSYVKIEHNEKRKYLDRFLKVEKPKACIVFCNTRRVVDRVSDFLNEHGFNAKPLHGAITQARRTKTIEQFKKGKFEILVATDVAARGIHVDALDLVINYDVPIDLDNYVHRIGRTGRAGLGGKAITLATGDDIMTLYEIEEHIGVMIPEGVLPSYREAHGHIKYHKPPKKHSHKPDIVHKHEDKPRKKRPSKDKSADKTVKTRVLKGSAKAVSTAHVRHDKSQHESVQYQGKQLSKMDVAAIVAAYKTPKRKRLLQRLKDLFIH